MDLEPHDKVHCVKTTCPCKINCRLQKEFMIWRWEYLLLHDGVKGTMDILSHAFGIPTDINVTTLWYRIPNIQSLYHPKHVFIRKKVKWVRRKRRKSSRKQAAYFVHHFVLYIFLCWPLPRESNNQFRECTGFSEVSQFILVNVILHEQDLSKFWRMKHLCKRGEKYNILPNYGFGSQRIRWPGLMLLRLA